MYTCTKYTVLNNTVTFNLYFDESLNDTHYAIILQYPKLSFQHWFNKPIVLTLSLTHVTFGCGFKQPLILSKNLTHLTFDDKYNVEIFLTKKMLFLKIGNSFNLPIRFNKQMRYVSLGQCYNQKLELGKYNTHLILNGVNYSHPIFLTKHIVCMMFMDSYICDVQLNIPKTLTHLQLAYGYNKPIILTKHINTLIINKQYSEKIYFEKPISYLKISIENNFLNDNLSNNIKLLELYKSLTCYQFYTHTRTRIFPNNLPNCIKTITSYT